MLCQFLEQHIRATKWRSAAYCSGLLTVEKQVTREVRGLRHLVVQKNLDILRRLIGGKDARRAVVSHRVRQRLVVGKIREVKTGNEIIKGLRIRDPAATKEDGAMGRQLLHEPR